MAISYNPKGSGATALVSLPPSSTRLKQSGGIISRFVKPVKSWELTVFTSQLSLMLEIGTSLNIALKSIGEEIENPAFKAVIFDMYKGIEEGRQLSDAMRSHPQVFNNTFISMVKAGETGGFLKKILDRIVEMQEKRQAIITQLQSSLTYPVILCVVGFLVVVFIIVGVLPRFTTFFEGKESILPWTTRFLMITSASLRGYWWIYIISAVGLFSGFILWNKSERGKTLIDRFVISGPLVAGLSNKIYTGAMLRTLGHLMESQVPLLEALEATRSTIGNRYYQRFIDKIIGNVQQGGRFSRPFAAYPYVPVTVKQMVSIGEEVGNLSTVMLRLAKYYDTEVEQELKKFAAMIEPLALIVMGAVVGLIVSSVILPMFKLAQAVH